MHLAEVYKHNLLAEIMIDISSKDESFNPHKELYPILNALKCDWVFCSIEDKEGKTTAYGPCLILGSLDQDPEDPEMEEFLGITEEEKEEARLLHNEATEAFVLLAKAFQCNTLRTVEVVHTEIIDDVSWYK
jgi:hypothetical protein